MRFLSVFTLVVSLSFAGALHAKKAKRTITLDVQNADVHNVLRLISEVGRINIVTDDSVSGKVTLKLRKVHWKDAFEIVLKTKGLLSERHAKNLYRVAPREVIIKERAQKAELYQSTQKLAPLRTSVFSKATCNRNAYSAQRSGNDKVIPLASLMWSICPITFASSART